MTFFLMVWSPCLLAQVGLGQPIADHGDHAFLRSPSRQNRRLATRLGKFMRKPLIMAIAKKSGAHAEIGERRWGKFQRKRFIMAFTLFTEGAHAKTRDWVWGKSNGKPFIMAIPQQKAGIAPKPTTRDPFGEILSGIRLSWRSWSKTRAVWRNLSD